MSLFHTFDAAGEEILKPAYVAPTVEGFPKTVIVTFKERMSELVPALFHAEVVSCIHAAIVIPIYRFPYGGQTLGLCLSTIGGAAAAGTLEELFSKGAERVLFLGSCGVLDEKVAAGKLILPTAAYRDEGVSYHYLPAGDYVDIPTAQRLAEVFDELNLPYVMGKTWTTDAFYRETRRNADARRSEGCLTVEMECASVMAVGEFRKKTVYQFLWAEDSLAGEVWDQRSLGKMPVSKLETYLRIALESAIRL